MWVECYNRIDTGWDLRPLMRPERALRFSAFVFEMTPSDVCARATLLFA